MGSIGKTRARISETLVLDTEVTDDDRRARG